MKSSGILRKAKTRLWDGVADLKYCGYATTICRAIKTVSDDFKAVALTRVITHRIFPQYTLNSWLERAAGIPEYQLTSPRVQAHRHSWLEMLIAEYEAKGD